MHPIGYTKDIEERREELDQQEAAERQAEKKRLEIHRKKVIDEAVAHMLSPASTRDSAS